MPNSNYSATVTALATLIVIAVPYFFGFVYLESYFRYFGITLDELDLPEGHVYVSAFFALKGILDEDSAASRSIIFVVVVIFFSPLIIAALREASILPDVSRLNISFSLPWAVVALSTFLYSSYDLARTAGHKNASGYLEYSTKSQLYFLSDMKGVVNLNALRELGLLVHSTDSLLHASKSDFFFVRVVKRDAQPLVIRVRRDAEIVSIERAGSEK